MYTFICEQTKFIIMLHQSYRKDEMGTIMMNYSKLMYCIYICIFLSFLLFK